MSLHFAKHILIVNSLQIIGELLILTGKQTKEGEFTGPLPANQAEHLSHDFSVW